MQPTGTKFKKFNIEWEIISTNEVLSMYYCANKNKSNGKLEFRDFKAEQLQGVEFY